MNAFAGIDPGVTGAIAVLDDTIYDLPTLTIEGKKKKTVLDVRAAAAILREINDTWAPVFLLEAPTLGPAMAKQENGEGGQSIVSMAGTFYLCGQLCGILAAIGARYEIINPQTWKRAMMPGEARDKDAARQKAIALFPIFAEALKLKKHHNRAEALLLAEYGRRRG